MNLPRFRWGQSRPTMLLAVAALSPAVFICSRMGQMIGLISLCFALISLLAQERVQGLRLMILIVFFINFLRVWNVMPGPAVKPVYDKAELQLGKLLWHSPERGKCAFLALLPGVGKVCLDGDEQLLQLERVRGRVRLKCTEGAANPGSFDEAGWLAGYGVFYRAEIVQLHAATRKSNILGEFRLKFLDEVRQFWEIELGREESAFLQALLFGDKGLLTVEQKSSIFLLGIEHITAVSGMHLIFLLAPFRFPFVSKRVSPKARLFLQLPLILFWNVLCGFPPGLIRASSILVLNEVKRSYRLRFDHLSLLCLSAFLMGLWEPFSILNKGFLWSYAAVTSLFVLGTVLAKQLKTRLSFVSDSANDALSSLFAAQSAMIFLNAERFSLISPLLSLMQLPAASICGLIFVLALPLVLLHIAGFSRSFLKGPYILLLKGISGIWQQWLKTVPHLPCMRCFDFSTAPLFATFLLWLVFPLLPWIKRLFRGREKLFRNVRLVILATTIVFWCLRGFFAFPCEMTFLSVGQGEAFVIRCDRDWILYDGGKEGSALNVILPFMQAKGISEFSAAVLSHGHLDHIGGILELASLNRVRSIYLPAALLEIASEHDGRGVEYVDKLIETAQNNGIELKIIRENDRILLDRDRGYFIEFTSGASRIADPDTDCMIARLCYRDKSLLLTADMSVEQEAEYVREDKRMADVLKVAHHGSKTVTGEAFLAYCRPVAAILSVGPNQYGHPADSVLERLDMRGVNLFRTDLDGAVNLRFEEDGSWRITTWKSGRSMVLRPVR